MRSLFTMIMLLFAGQTLQAQDFITDRSNTGKPVFLRQNANDTTDKKLLFSLGANVSDATAIKVNLYKHTWGVPKNYTSGSGTEKVGHTNILSTGWGAYLHGKNKEGVAKLFKSGNFDPGVTGGIYRAWIWNSTQTQNGTFTTSNQTLIFYADISFGSFQFYDPAASFDKQISSKSFSGPSAGLSYLKRPSMENGNVFWGGSITWARTSNYDDLDTYELKNDSLTSSNGMTRKVTKINPNGDTYAVGTYDQFSEYRFRANFVYIPATLDYRFAFSIYPSVNVGGNQEARLNTGIGFHYLEDGNPTASIFSLNFELNDLGNAAESSKTFLKRSFKVGVSTNLNFFKKAK